ncbi:hypothetical protein [Hymenobacter cellulosivorans]|uniref:DUF3823 domain-containing protein n=1 Tax=Hymenobacter cellulosivorans TaxID=2932249 RepID=A0ABY4FH61_9BACT|nr:hypothetical protein [Hymenobacter cellulosivorans]UOQ55471.1 hypothetical protein MUN80_12090 [Hymenobacter cellulosivorans]
MKRLFLCYAAAASLLGSTSCSEKEEVFQTTIVEGRVMNPYTNQPVAGVPVVVHQIISGGFLSPGNHSIDSIAGAHSDETGHYQLVFGAKETRDYEVKLDRQDQVYDLDRGYDGHFDAQPGRTNSLNFKVTPYKNIKVTGVVDKEGRNSVNIQGAMIARTRYTVLNVFTDTVRTNQRIAFTQTVKVVPNQEYQFTKSTYNLVKLPSGTYESRAVTFTNVRLYVGYNDTTVALLN